MRRRSPSLLLLPALFLPALLLAGCGHSPDADPKPAPPLPPVQVAPSAFATLTKTLSATGNLAAPLNRTATLAPPVSGVLDALPVRVGQQVSQGQVIAHLATSQMQGQIRQAQATLGQNQVQVGQAQANALQQQAQTRAAIAQAQSAVSGAQATLAGARATLLGDQAALRNAQQTLTREKVLFADGLVAQKDVETAELAVRTAQATSAAQEEAVRAQAQTVAGQRQALAAARSAVLQDAVKRQDILVARQQVQNAAGALSTARAQEALYTLRAPLSGQITQIGASVGETVDATTKIATVADLHTLQLQIAVPGDAVRQVRPGEEVMFTVPGLPGRTFQTTIRTLSSQVDPVTGTVTAFALVPNPLLALQADQTVKAQIVTERLPGVLTVPASAVLTDPATGKASVVVVDAGGTAHILPVTTGLSAGGRVQITGGLAPGRSVAVSGQFGLPDGTKVQVQGAAPNAP